MLEADVKWDNEYLTIYSIYKPHTKEGMRSKDILIKTRKEDFLNKWCSKEYQYYRFSARDDEHAKNMTLLRKNCLENIGEVAVVIIDDFLKINSIKDKINIEESLSSPKGLK